jgi:hypothetical protein
LNAYLETNAPRKKQKFVDALKAATNKVTLMRLATAGND